MMTRINELNDIIFSLENELESVNDQLASANLQIAIYADDYEALRMKHSTLRNHNDELRDEVRFYSREAKRLGGLLNEAESSLESLDDTISSLTADYEDLRMKHSALRNQNAALMAENEKFKNGYGISALIDENSDLINSIVKARNILDNAIS